MQHLTAQQGDERIDRGFSRLLEQAAPLSGSRRVGWKVGITSPAMQRRLGLSGPVLGVLTSSTLQSDGVLTAPRGGTLLVEAELALRLGAPPAIAAVAPALELLCIDRPPDDLEELIARSSFHAGYALGPWTPGNPVERADDLSLELRIDGEPGPALDPELVIGAPHEIVDFADAFLAARGERLAEGDVVLCGSLNGPAVVAPGQRVAAQVGPAGAIACEIA